MFSTELMIHNWIHTLKILMSTEHNLWTEYLLVIASSGITECQSLALYLIESSEHQEHHCMMLLLPILIEDSLNLIANRNVDGKSVRRYRRLSIRPRWCGMCVNAFLHSCTTVSSGGSFSGYGGCLESHTIPHRRLWHTLQIDILVDRIHKPYWKIFLVYFSIETRRTSDFDMARQTWWTN